MKTAKATNLGDFVRPQFLMEQFYDGQSLSKSHLIGPIVARLYPLLSDTLSGINSPEDR